MIGKDVSMGVKSHLGEPYRGGPLSSGLHVATKCSSSEEWPTSNAALYLSAMLPTALSLYPAEQEKRIHKGKTFCAKHRTSTLPSIVWNPYDLNPSWQWFHLEHCSPSKSCQGVLAEWGGCYIETQRAKYLGTMEPPLWALRNNWERGNLKIITEELQEQLKVGRKWEQ